ncbi:MAG: TatD family hydrolase [Treponema sp.]|uniref:TatD family hydrolase n=1 Tax=Treponema sp. TaxID=166 RepID=UPI0025D64A9D|nr:TatD family hydrolase [Treponema sp.]MBQ9623682.1 TatD family hydrolase [Treponema sp.]MBR0099862.1 TatD family hydrolase [Treponema sp.]MBR0496749.1 TatD family hydrolase [Treponema sp.]
MYSDSLMNFFQITEELGLEQGADSLKEMERNDVLFALDTGIHADDIWARAGRVEECLDLIDDDIQRKHIQDMMYFTAGVMPDSDSVDNRFEIIENLENVINEFKESDSVFASHLVGIGPGGIDHDWDSVEFKGRDHEYFDYDTVKDEEDLFALQLTLAKKLNMPFVLHSRKGFKETSDVLKAVKWNRGVIHGFSYNQSELGFFLDLGWYVSFSGTVTYAGKKSFSDMSDLLNYVPKDRLLIETDCPFYPPVPVKSGSNIPANIKYIYEYIASKRNITSRKLSEIVDSNFQKLFGI